MSVRSRSHPYPLDSGPSDAVDNSQPHQGAPWLRADNRDSIGRFDDASEDERPPSLDLPRAMSSFHPPPPRTLPLTHHHPLRDQENTLPTSTSASSLSAERRLPISLNSTLRGNRAPAPAALDLSPRSERIKAEMEGQAVQGAMRRVSRPLPVPPDVPLRSSERPIYIPDLTSAPLSAVGQGATPQVFPDPPAQSRPGTPSSPDPSTLNRNNLIGVGELSTPRWAASGPSSYASSSSIPPQPTLAPTGVGLGINAEADSTPKRTRPDRSDPLLSLNTLADFDFDSSMTAALAASLSVPDEPPAALLAANRDHRASAPAHPQTSWELPTEFSPNTARARIYARRQSRQMQQAPPKQTPPHSADSTVRNSRRTPPQSSAKSRQSPNTAHHEIMKHFAPKDFSHLPPSPSSASINQFLRGSGSVNNFASIGTPPAGPSTSYFPSSTSTKGIQRSNSLKGSSGWEGQEINPDTAEALRKLDGLSTTPGKKTPRTKTSTSATSISSRPGTPPATRAGKPMPKSTSSPLNNWVDLADEVPIVPSRLGKPADITKRESSSSTSLLGTPTSKDSLSLPTTSPSSASVKEKPSRRASAGSDVSSHSDADLINVPPVPPIPLTYSAVRPSPSEQSPPVQSPSSVPSDSNARPRQMSKKWSFSSALNLRLNTKDSSPASSPGLPEEMSTPWSEVHHPSSDDGSRTSTTPVASTLSAPMPKPGQNKRLTPSSIPFFRRTSSSSMPKSETAISPPTLPAPAAPRNAQSSSVRKSVLGMSIPSMLRGNSKRHVSQQTLPEESVAIVDIPAEMPQSASTGWTGRKRGKTLSISGDVPGKLSAPPASQTLRAKPSTDSQGSSAQSSRSGSTLHAMPPIASSPALRHPNSTSSLRESPRNLPSATPTKIPRMARPAESPARGSMPPPAFPAATGSRSNGMSSRTTSASISEFGSVNGVHATPRQTTSGTHRAHLSAPMSARADNRRGDKVSEPLVRHTSGQVVPPSRRHLPMAPSITAPTASSIAKRASRESAAVQNGSSTPLSNTSPIKPSKSLHAKLVLPAPSRLPSSSSVGAPSSRKTSLVADSPSVSPAEDDETQADQEMVAYVKRRKARHASGKKEDLSDIDRFPEDAPPTTPITQREFISRNLSSLTDFERKEILDYDKIYYTPTTKISRPAQTGGAVYNYGYDDERGDYIVVDGDHLCYRYEVTGTLGKGSFGQVVGCRDHKTGGSTAIKIIRNKKRFHTQALVEVKILQQLVEWDPEDRHYMVRMSDHFYFRGHLCIVTEMLSINLYELIKANQFAGFSTVLIRRFTAQMLSSLQLMRSHRIVHCDLKPENILLTHPSKSGIKVIDFGSSCLETEKVYTYIQSRFYRSPEVILGMNYAMAIDMWSLGCILAELYTGVPIFPGENEHEQLACIMEVLGVPERYIVEKASRRKLFFDATGAPRPFVNGKGKRRRPGAKTLSAVLKCNDDQFVDFISKCLTWDPDKRLKPQPALRHPWILAGRRRQVPTAPTSMSTSSLRSRADGPTNGVKGKSSLLISPPTPLQARTGQPAAPATAPRFGHATRESNVSSSGRMGQMRADAYASPQKG